MKTIRIVFIHDNMTIDQLNKQDGLMTNLEANGFEFTQSQPTFLIFEKTEETEPKTQLVQKELASVLDYLRSTEAREERLEERITALQNEVQRLRDRE